MTTNQFKPLLAYTVEDTSKLPYPHIVASYKYDGIRVIVLDGVVYSRSMKPLRSKVAQKLFGRADMNGLDGEIIYGSPNAANVFSVTTSAAMSTNMPEGFDERNMKFYAFDDVLSNGDFAERSCSVLNKVLNLTCNNVEAVQHKLVTNEQELLKFEAEALDFGMEGLMVRTTYGKYKQGRSTAKEGIIGKIKRFSDDETVVIGFEEKMTNTNEKLKNELGYSQRSQAQEGMVGAGTLGALICECNGIRFTMGSGFDDVGRDEVWQNKDKYLNKLAKFKYFAVGMKDSYRFPIFLGWRHEDDLC